MITPQRAAAVFKLNEREVFRFIENGRLHFVEAERIFVCRDSLTNGTARVKRRFIKGEKNEKYIFYQIIVVGFGDGFELRPGDSAGESEILGLVGTR
jgi:hypothetical protein